MRNASTIRIWHERLAAVGPDGERLPLSSLTPGAHVHGGLRLEIAGRRVPYMGYWGEDDVCFGQWLEELQHAVDALHLDDGRHVFDEGEQGQPAFVFERSGSKGCFSIAPSMLSDADGDPDWHRVEFSPPEFFSEFARMRSEFIAEILQEAPIHGAGWLARTLGDA